MAATGWEIDLPHNGVTAPPALITRAGPASAFVWDEFFTAGIRNSHTRRAYAQAVHRILAWAESQGHELARLTLGMLGGYLDSLPGTIPTKKQHLAAPRGIFDALVLRHVVILNPALSVKAERCEIIEGKTPEIAIDQARSLLRSIDTGHVVGLLDRAVIGVLIKTAARIDAVTKLQRKDLRRDDGQWSLRFDEKRGKSREFPLCHDLQLMLLTYLEAAGRIDAAKDAPLFTSANGNTRHLATTPVSAGDLGRMVKRRMRDAVLPEKLSPRGFRMTTPTNPLAQDVPLEEVQNLLGPADACTTRFHDRRQRQVKRNVVEGISA